MTMFKIGVFGLVFDKKGRVLLAHRRDWDLWNLPGGGLEEGEVLWEGVVREIKEETGLGVEVVRVSGVYAKPDAGEVVFSFVCRVVGGELGLSEEADELKYFPVNKLPREMFPKQAERVRDAVKNPKKVVMKVQKGPSSVELVKVGRL
jgi:8-oxo-dGTP diphosphatase